MSNAVCIRDDCNMFFMYNRKTNGEIDPFIREICNNNGENVVTDFSIDGTSYQDVIVEEIVPEDIDVEQQLMCDGTTTFIRWFVYVKSNPGLNFKYDTDLTGAAYSPAGTVKAGGCLAGDDCETHTLYQRNGDTISPFLRKICPGRDPVYYGIDGNEIDASEITGELLFPEDVDIHQQLMCSEGVSIIRWHVAIRGRPSGIYYDTDMEGADLVPPPDPTTMTPGACNCPKVSLVPLCDIDPGKMEAIDRDQLPLSYERTEFSGQAFAETPNALTWMTEAKLKPQGFVLESSIRWQFSSPVMVEFTFLSDAMGHRCLNSTQPLELVEENVRVTYDASTKQVCSSPISGNAALVVVRANDVTDIAFTASSLWYLTTVRFIKQSEPVPFLKKTETGCDGLEAVSYVTADGDPYVIKGQIGECT